MEKGRIFSELSWKMSGMNFADPKQKKGAECAFVRQTHMKTSIRIFTDKGTMDVSLEELIRENKALKKACIEGFEMCVENDEGTSLVAHADIDEEFPFIDIDGYHNDRRFYLVSTEMPNECYPDSFTARLYAGCADADETDSPVAFVRTSVKRDFPEIPPTKPLKKLVYVDEDIAEKRTWKGAHFPEHREDEN